MQDIGSSNMLFEQAQKLQLKPQWTSISGVFTILVNHKKLYLFASRTPLNTELNAYFSRNKRLTRVLLDEYNLPNIPYCIPHTNEDIINFQKEHKKIVIKPKIGEKSQGIHFVTKDDDLPSVDLQDIIVEKYINGKEFRYLVLNNNVIAVHERNITFTDKQSIKKRIAFDKIYWDKKLVDLSLKTASALSLTFAAVDFIIDQANNVYIMEVNSAPAIWPFHFPDKGEPVNVAKVVLEEIIKQQNLSA